MYSIKLHCTLSLTKNKYRLCFPETKTNIFKILLHFKQGSLITFNIFT